MEFQQKASIKSLFRDLNYFENLLNLILEDRIEIIHDICARGGLLLQKMHMTVFGL